MKNTDCCTPSSGQASYPLATWSLGSFSSHPHGPGVGHGALTRTLNAHNDLRRILFVKCSIDNFIDRFKTVKDQRDEGSCDHESPVYRTTAWRYKSRSNGRPRVKFDSFIGHLPVTLNHGAAALALFNIKTPCVHAN
jgi:hypothetical protein